MRPDERQWLEATYAAHHVAVCGYLQVRADDLDWQSIAQDVFLTASSKFETAPAEPRAWLLGIARGLQANAARRHFHGDVLLLAETPLLAIAELDPAALLAAQLDLRRLVRAWQGLTAGQREVLLLGYDGMSAEQIADRTGRTDATAVRAARSRALKRLRQAFHADDRRDPA